MMKKELIKHFSYGVAFALLILLALVAAGAMFLTDDKEEIFGLRNYKRAQAMEIRGNWLGMRLTSMESSTARHYGVPPTERGVMVTEIEERSGWRARMAGVQQGDVIKGVNGKEIRDLADLYDLSRDLDVGSTVSLDIQRWGQPMTLVLPAVYAPPPVAAPPQARQGDRGAPMTGQIGNAGAAQPAALVQGPQEPMFHCPLHNRQWPQSEVHPHYRCPLGNCPLNRVPGARGGNAGATQPAALVQGSRSPLFYCSIHNRTWPQHMVHPNYRCLLGSCPLNRVR